NVETSSLPALASSSELLLPFGSLAPPLPSYSVKAMATKTFPFGRLHLNVADGTYSVNPPAAAGDTACTVQQFQLTLTPGSPSNCRSIPFVPDVPCGRSPASTDSLRPLFCSRASGAGFSLVAAAPRARG